MEDRKKHFLDHLEDLRRRVLVSIIAVSILTALSYTFAENILRLLSRYVGELVFISPEEAFISYLKVSLFSGLVLSSPVIIFNALGFVWVALKKEEKRILFLYLSLGIFLFAAGLLFSYFLALPVGINFLLSFSSDWIKPCISISRYISFSVFFILAFAVAFEIPLFIILLTRLGIVEAAFLRKKRKYIIVFMFVLAAILTPPDVVTQVLLAIPLIALYELSVFLAGIVERRRGAQWVYRKK